MGFSSNFLQSPPEDWPENVEYKNATGVLRHLKVTNEGAERSVKLVADFLHLTKIEPTLQNYLQVVEAERKATPDIRCIAKRQKPGN